MTVTWTTRYGASPHEVGRMGTTELRAEFLIPGLFAPGEARMAYTRLDRMVVGGIAPTAEPIAIGDGAAVGTGHPFEAREGGIANLGGSGGTAVVDGEEFRLAPCDILYVGRGARAVAPASDDAGDPALFYLNSVPAGAALPHRLVTREEAKAVTMGEAARSNRRTLRMYIHPEVAPSCLLLMGITDPEPGSVWNTMPPHLHERRMEAYLYFGMAPQDRVMHFMGRPEETRHLVEGSGDAVLSPGWSIHMGAGTGPYAFVWGMTGENQVYRDVDPVPVEGLR